MAVLGLGLMAMAEPLLSVFDIERGTPLAAYTVDWVRILGAGMPVTGIWIALAGTLQGAGHTMASLRINGAATLLIQIPLSWVLGFPLGLGPFGVWLAFPIAFALKAILGGFAYRQGRWAKVGTKPVGI